MMVGAWWLYLDPIDRFQPDLRSDRRPSPIAVLQQERADEIRSEVRELFDTIRMLWKERYPNEPMGQLAGPASEEQIARLERHVGPLPIDFRAYLELHNGHVDKRGGFYGYQPLLSCDEMLEQSADLLKIGQDYQEVPLHHQDVWFHPGCLIFEEEDGGGFVLNASTGVVYRWDHDGVPLSCLAENFTELLQRMVRNLKSSDGPTTSYSNIEKQDLKK